MATVTAVTAQARRANERRQHTAEGSEARKRRGAGGGGRKPAGEREGRRELKRPPTTPKKQRAHERRGRTSRPAQGTRGSAGGSSRRCRGRRSVSARIGEARAPSTGNREIATESVQTRAVTHSDAPPCPASDRPETVLPCSARWLSRTHSCGWIAERGAAGPVLVQLGGSWQLVRLLRLKTLMLPCARRPAV